MSPLYSHKMIIEDNIKLMILLKTEAIKTISRLYESYNIIQV